MPAFFKIFAILSFCLILISSCKQSRNAESKQVGGAHSENELPSLEKAYPKFEFTKEIHTFGEILEGEIVVCDFYYRNIGNANLIIKAVESSCGCTAVSWNKEPLRAGDEAKLSVEFDTKGRHGKQYKVISIFSNTKRKVKELKITAVVK